jgi:NAD(P)-dependent dehydrogenase (short-subunit alcohol dehydrogenase family)
MRCSSSSSGLFGNVGQTNYGAAKAGIAAFTIIAARELKRYGVTVNAISPHAQTRMTEGIPWCSSRSARNRPGVCRRDSGSRSGRAPRVARSSRAADRVLLCR